jgi:tetratricopeptide (TPR) repeat protein
MLDLAPNFALGYNNLANIYYAMGQIERAIENCDRAVDMGLEVHPEFLRLLDRHRGKAKKQAAGKSKAGKPVTANRTHRKGKTGKSKEA